jgi:hypothetical protein
VTQLQDALNHLRQTQYHTPDCELKGPQKLVKDPSGFVYDVYIFLYCDCWLTRPDPEGEEALKFVRSFPIHYGFHDPDCPILFPYRDTYRGRPVTVHKNCACWLAVDNPQRK